MRASFTAYYRIYIIHDISWCRVHQWSKSYVKKKKIYDTCWINDEAYSRSTNSEHFNKKGTNQSGWFSINGLMMLWISQAVIINS